jgi:hypothetical protein
VASLEILADQRFEVSPFLLTGWAEIVIGAGRHG